MATVVHGVSPAATRPRLSASRARTASLARASSSPAADAVGRSQRVEHHRAAPADEHLRGRHLMARRRDLVQRGQVGEVAAAERRQLVEGRRREMHAILERVCVVARLGDEQAAVGERQHRAMLLEVRTFRRVDAQDDPARGDQAQPLVARPVARRRGRPRPCHLADDDVAVEGAEEIGVPRKERVPARRRMAQEQHVDRAFSRGRKRRRLERRRVAQRDVDRRHAAPLEFGDAGRADVEDVSRLSRKLPRDFEPLAARLLDVEHGHRGKRGLQLDRGTRAEEVQRKVLVRRDHNRQGVIVTVLEWRAVDDDFAGDALRAEPFGEQARDVGHELVAGGGDVELDHGADRRALESSASRTRAANRSSAGSCGSRRGSRSGSSPAVTARGSHVNARVRPASAAAAIVVSSNAPNGYARSGHRAAGDAFEHDAAVRHLTHLSGAILPRQLRVVNGMSADSDAVTCEVPQFVHRHPSARRVARGMRRPRRHLCKHTVARLCRERHDRVIHNAVCEQPLTRCCRRQPARAARQVQRQLPWPRAVAEQQRREPIPPEHVRGVEPFGGDKARRRKPVPRQDRHGVGQRVEVAVVEGECDGTVRQRAVARALHQLLERQHRAV